METHKNGEVIANSMSAKRTMPICLKPDELVIIEEYAKRNGLTNYSQAIEKVASKSNK